jgi:hypothetical protein
MKFASMKARFICFSQQFSSTHVFLAPHLVSKRHCARDFCVQGNSAKQSQQDMESGVYQSGWHECATKTPFLHERTYQNQQLGKAAERRNSPGREKRKSPAGVPTKVDLRVCRITFLRKETLEAPSSTSTAFSRSPWQSVLPVRHFTLRHICLIFHARLLDLGFQLQQAHIFHRRARRGR